MIPVPGGTRNIDGSSCGIALQLAGKSLAADPWADSKTRTTLGFHNLHHRNIRAQNWGFYFWILPGVWAPGFGRLPGSLVNPKHLEASELQPGPVFWLAVSTSTFSISMVFVILGLKV